jgi:hypothetical protein
MKKLFSLLLLLLLTATTRGQNSLHLQPAEFFHLMTEATFEEFDSLTQHYLEAVKGYQLLKAETVDHATMAHAELIPADATTYRLAWLSANCDLHQSGLPDGLDYSCLQVVMTPATHAVHSAVMQYARQDYAEEMERVLLSKGYVVKSESKETGQKLYALPREGECYDAYSIVKRDGFYYISWYESL